MLRFTPDAAETLRRAIREAGGVEVFAIGDVESGTVVGTTISCRGTEQAVPALFERPRAGQVVIHNHPSGDPDPSAEDLRVTHRLYRCGQWLGIPVLDHVICGRGDWCSLRESSLGPWSPSGGEESHHADETGVDGTL